MKIIKVKRFNKELEVIDKININKIVTKYDENEAPRRGMNYTDGSNKIGEVSVTGYLCKDESGNTYKILAEDIIKIIE